ncbi:MAG: hypothetical protein IJA08_03270 [Clostridia bacterium]|nr:hypothetical protein [Clostridia bacterium]
MKKISKFLSAILCMTLLLSVAVIPSVSADAAAATLTDLTFDGYIVPNFDPATTEYTVTLPYRHYDQAGVSQPVVTATVDGGNAVISDPVYNATAQTGTVTVTVADKTYTINYTVIGDNLLGNPGFEAWGGSLDAWSGRGDYAVRETNEKVEGATAAKLTHTSGKYLYQPIDFKNSTTDTNDPDEVHVGWSYLLSGQFKVPEGDAFLTAQDNGPKTFNLYDMSNNITSLPCSTEWQRLTGVTVGAASTGVSITPWGAAGTFYVDDFYAGELVVADINISGAPEAAITEAGTVDLDATVVNQMGTTHGITHAPVAWRLVNAPAGVSIDADGVVTIAEGIEYTGNVIVEATAVPTFGPADQQAVQTLIGERVSIPVNMVDNTKARLSDLTFDGYTIPGFDPAQTVYNVKLPYRHYVAGPNKYLPAVTGAIEEGGSVVVSVPAYTAATKTGTVTVTAKKDGLADRVYTINYTVIGDNLITNPGFEWGNAGSWENRGDGVATVVSDEKIEGNYSCLVNTPDGNKYIFQAINCTDDPDTVNDDWSYLISGQFKLPADSTLIGRNFMLYGNNDKNSDLRLAGTTEWQRLTTVWPGTANLAAAVTCWQPGTYYVDDFYAGELVAADINVSGAQALITAAGEFDLNGTIVNQLGTTEGLTQAPISWRLVSAPAGVGFDATTGVVTVPDNCVGKIVVEATAVPVIGPAAQQANQTIIGKRVEMIAAINAPATVTYGTDGDMVTPTINWFNATGASKTVRVYTAVYSLDGTKKVLEDVVVNDAVTVDNGALYNVALTPITKKADCTIETFVWTTDYRPLIGPFAYAE